MRPSRRESSSRRADPRVVDSSASMVWPRPRTQRIASPRSARLRRTDRPAPATRALASSYARCAGARPRRAPPGARRRGGRRAAPPSSARPSRPARRARCRSQRVAVVRRLDARAARRDAHVDALRPRAPAARRAALAPAAGARASASGSARGPNVAGFVFPKRVTGLQVPASYRALVRFRWHRRRRHDRQARARAHAARAASPTCARTSSPGALTRGARRAAGRSRIYTLVVRNSGRSAAGPFSVARRPAQRARSRALGAGEQRAVRGRRARPASPARRSSCASTPIAASTSPTSAATRRAGVPAACSDERPEHARTAR